MASIYAQRDGNIRKTWLMFTSFLIITIGIGWVFSQIYGSSAISRFVVIFTQLLMPAVIVFLFFHLRKKYKEQWMRRPWILFLLFFVTFCLIGGIFNTVFVLGFDDIISGWRRAFWPVVFIYFPMLLVVGWHRLFQDLTALKPSKKIVFAVMSGVLFIPIYLLIWIGMPSILNRLIQ